MPRRAPALSVSLPFPLAILLPLLALPPSSARGDGLAERIDPLTRAHKGRIAVAVKHLGTGESYVHNAKVPMPTASLIKFPVMIEAYRQAEAGAVKLDALITLREEDKVPGSGVLTYHFSAGAAIPLRDAIRLMIAYSDNTATNMVVDAIGLPATTARMAELGFPDTRLHSKVFRRDTSIDPEGSREFGLGRTTAADMVALLERLRAKTLVSEAASAAMYEHMLNCQDKDLIPRHLPPGTKIAQKTGAVSDVRTAAGVIETPGGPVALCVMTRGNEDQRWTPDNAAERVIAEIAREVYNHFQKAGDAKPASGPPDLRIGATGPAVERLQRALNARLDPSPGLAVDGDFGPATESALLRFKRERGLGEEPVADAAVREALGPEPEAADAAPPPEVVNARAAEARRRAPDDPDAPPAVTAKGWVVLDGGTGAILAGGDPETPLDNASTTKIMTARLVLKLARDNPAVLDEIVTFTRAADRVPGSTADVREGERVSVRELLYGLMLPSGNDAAHAFAEHFGRRLGGIDVDQAAGDDPLDPVAAFVAAMNREAADLGLANTAFRNPHGLTAPGHKSSPADLARLARACFELPGFAEVVNTRTRGATLVDVKGTARNIVWSNTNKLLEIEGFDGVKTGTTNAAGACLVARGERPGGGAPLYVVVLGSQSSDARYVDARNLFRWARTKFAASSSE